jgi:hypothetical protein
LRKSAGARHGQENEKKARQEKGQVGIYKNEGRRNRSALRELFFPLSLLPLW